MKKNVVMAILVAWFGFRADDAKATAIFVPEAAYTTYAILTGVTVLGVSYYAAEAAPSLKGITIRFPKISGKTADLNSFKTVTDREIAIKAKLQAIVAKYRNIRQEIEAAYKRFGATGTIDKQVLIDFYDNIRSFANTYEEVSFTLLANSIDDAEELSGSDLLAGTTFGDYVFEPSFDPKCDPNEIAESFRKKKYKVITDKQAMEIQDQATKNEYVNRLLHSIENPNAPGIGERTNVFHLYKKTDNKTVRHCEMHIDPDFKYYEIRTAIHKNTMQMYENVLNRDPDVAIIRTEIPEDCHALTNPEVDLCQQALELFFSH